MDSFINGFLHTIAALALMYGVGRRWAERAGTDGEGGVS
jgi:hypothetical protein